MDWKQILDAVDDDYLIGISNKGIVKRAYKDKQESTESMTVVENCSTELKLSVGGETVNICYPLGESKCSCPSRSICRHVVLGILLAKEQMETKAEAFTESDEGQMSEKTDAASFMDLKPDVMEEIKAYPLKSLLRVLGVKSLRGLVENMQANVFPTIQQTSIVTVKLPGQDIVVKLLSPLEYSSCSCHKKELCSHKAEAILWCQWSEKVITTELLQGEADQTSEFDREQMKDVAGMIKNYLEELLSMGLCRTSSEVVNSLERLAVFAHNAELPRVENSLRALADTYAKYLKRSTTFSVNDSLRRLIRLYHQMSKLLETDDNRVIAGLAGKFRAEYKFVGELDLIGITWEHFVSRSGYEGDTIYFLEENTGKWYTYTNARPIFYEGGRRSGYTEKVQAPWNLPISFEEMVNTKIHLSQAKCDDSGRISSGQETKAEVVEVRELSHEVLKSCYYDDFGKAFAEQMQVENGEEKLVFLKPSQMENAKFQEVEQVLRMPVWDGAGKKILIEVPYSKKEDATIRYLERMKEKSVACILGRLYLKDSRMQLYPLDVFTKKELPWCGEEIPELLPFLSSEMEKREEAKEGAYNAVSIILEQTETILGDLYQGGLDTVQESVLSNMKELFEMAEIYGLTYLAEQMSGLTEQISMQRHCINKTDAPNDCILRQFVILGEYVYIGRKKVMYDKAKRYYCDKEELE